MAVELSILNPSPKRLEGPNLLHQLVATHGNRQDLAVDYLSTDGITEKVSYSELHQRSDRLAQRLRGVWIQSQKPQGSNFIVPLFIGQCPDLYVAQLATLKAGGAFCPISLDVPEERLRFILQDVDAKILLTTTALLESLPELDGLDIIAADDDNGTEEGELLELDIHSSSPAYIMYTSGSTGQPKGVILSHSAGTQALLAHDPHIPPFSRFLQFASPTFDVSVFEIFFPFFRGGTLVCGERRQILSDLPGFVNQMDIDAAELTPSVASSLLRGRSSVPRLKTLLTIGEMLKHDVVEEFGGSSDQQAILHGMYGPTEATIHCTLQPAFAKDMSVGNIGIPLDTVSAFVLKPVDADRDPTSPPTIVAVGEEGELAVGGHQLADGYLNRPEQTAAAFVQHPEYGLLYRTGDRAKMTTAGKLECLGRISSGQVKLRGQRIELGEIEYAASKTPACRSVVAEVVSGTLVVFLIATAADIDPSEIFETCRKWLPAFMVPGDWMILESLPYLASGKVDRKALHTIYSNRATADESENEHVSPRLRTIIDVLGTALGHSVSASSQLATIGLDSLSAIRIASQLRKAGLCGLDATDLLDSRNPREIGEKLDASARTMGQINAARDESTIRGLYQAVADDERMHSFAEDFEDVFIPSPVQSAMLSETARNSKAYCNWIEFAVSATFDLTFVKRNLSRLSRQHALLRAGFLPLTNLAHTHAVIIWKELLPRQIQEVNAFNYSFAIDNEAMLLRPCSFQLMQSDVDIRILLSIHHALYDQWSIDILKADLDALLREKPLDASSDFSQVSTHYHRSNQDARQEASVDFWQDQLRDFAPSLLPPMIGKKLTPALQRTSWQPLSNTTADVRSAAHALGCSVPAVYQAAMVYMLGSYVGSTDVTYGAVFSGRHLPIPDIERVFGPCLSTLPVRLDYGATRTVRDLLRLIHDRNRAIQKNSLLPMSQIKSAASVTPNTKLFDVLFVWQESSFSGHERDSNVREVDSADQYEFNLVLEFEPCDDVLRTRATYQQSLIGPEQVDTLLRQVDLLANAILEAPKRLVKDLPQSLPDNALSVWNTDPSHCGSGHDMVRAIEHHTSIAPASPALVFADSLDKGSEAVQTLSYQDLNVRANRLAHHLHSIKKQPSELICICMEKSPDLYVAILATLKAGCGYLPLLPDVPPARFKSIIEQSQVKLCLCDARTAQTVESSAAVHVLDVTSKTAFDSMPGDNLPSTISGSDVAYTVFTSGSTGHPKGVAVTVDNLLGNLQALSELYQVQKGDRLLQACSQAFDVSVFEIFFSFYSGICLCSATKDVLFADLEASIRELEITHLSLTPTVAALIEPTNVPSVRFMVTAGEAVTELVHERWAGRGLHQGYGPSETTNICTINMAAKPDDVLGNIGPPFRNTSAIVVAPGSGFDVLPAGALGEFAFGGEQVFQGYVDMEELNAEKIINHPRFGRVYKSGDIGRILHDGTLLISGRLDDQVKIRGNRVELGEINAALLRHPDVHDCTTLLTGEHAAEQDLVSFVVLHSAGNKGTKTLGITTPDADHVEQLFAKLEDAIPSYMAPSMIVAVNKLPLTSQGKLDRRSLKALLDGLNSDNKSRFSRSSETLTEEEEWSDTERKIASILAHGLTISSSSVSRNSSFFGLGLNSLNAMSFAKHLTKSLTIQVNPGVVLRNPTVSRLARHIDRQSPQKLNGQSSDIANLLPRDLVSVVSSQLTQRGENIDQVLPCTPLQEVMISASASSVSSYCNTTWLNITGNLENLKRCWQEMVERHAILRTRFVETQSAAQPVVQVVLSDSRLPLTTVRGPSIGSAEEQEDEELQKVDGRAPFKMEVRTSSQGTKIALHMHHAIYDGLSMARLLHEVECRYREESLPSTPSFADFLRKTQEHNSSKAIEFWSSQLSGLRPSPFPYDTTRRDFRESLLQILTTVQQARLDAYCRRHGVTHLSLFQAALVKVLSYTQSITDVCIGNVVSGRLVPVDGIERLVAPCFNTVPVRANLGRIRSNLDLIKSLAQSNAEAADYQLSPLRRLQALSDDPSKRLFDALLLLQPSETDLDESIWSLERDLGSMGLPLVLEITPSEHYFALTVHHLEEVVSETIASQLNLAFLAAVESCLGYPFSDIAHFEGDLEARMEGALAPIEEATYANDHTDNSHKGEPINWTSEEAMIRTVFARLANVNTERIAKDTSMYQLGLDSLNAPQVASQLRSQGYSVDAADIMEGLTPRSIASSLETTHHDGDETSVDLEGFDQKFRASVLQVLQTQAENVSKIRPCTSVQNGMVAQSLLSQGALYVNHVTYMMPDGTSATTLRSAWTALLQKHELLRTGFLNLQDPEWPFAMAVWTPQAADVPLALADDETSLSEIEHRAKEFIMNDIGRPPWRITMSSTNKTSMTISMHHALYDAESLSILLSDLQLSLRSLSIGNALDIDPLLTATISSERQASKSSAAEEFWSTQLADAGFAKFPDLNPTAGSNSRLAVETLHCGAQMSDVEWYCRNQSASIQAFGQTVWALLLAAYTGEKTVTFGTVFSGRSSSSAWQTTFPSVTTVPISCDTDRQHAEIIAAMVDYNAAVQRYRSTPLADIQRLVGHPGGALFDTVFVYQKTTTSAEEVNWPIVRETAAVDYAASLELETNDTSKVHFRLTFDTGRIPPQQAQMMIQQYNMLFENMLFDRPLKRISGSELFSAVASRVPEIPSDVLLLHQFVERGALQHPDHVAFEFVSHLDGGSPVMSRWTYRELDGIGNQVAHAILEAGAVPGSVVALCMNKCPEATFAFVGILKAGCSFLALDPELPQERVSFILKDSGSTALLTSPASSTSISSNDVPVLDVALKGLHRFPRTKTNVRATSPGETCYVLYTSGTTGAPKGCEITHENAVQAMLAFQRLFSGHWTDQSRWLQFASYWFDVSVLEQFWSWSVGISVVGAPRDIVLEDIPAFIRALSITHIDLTPSLARLVLPDEVPSLWGGVFITGGEALKQEIIDAWGSKRTICNGYGPTEATIGVTMNKFVGAEAKPSNIGRAFDNVGAYVLGPDGHTPVIRGGVGELCVSGKLVGKGYLNRPDLTSKQFPFVTELGERLYRTGDLVRLLSDDSFQFIGRQDSQAKLRGQRLEIAEIDAVIRNSDSKIADVLSMVVKNEQGKETLVSFVTSSESSNSREVELDLADGVKYIVQRAQGACERKLPGYMVPTHIVPLTLLPLTVNNKVDAKRLTKLFESLESRSLQALKQQKGPTRSLNSIERKVCQVLTKLFPVDIEQTQGISNLFSLGLSSISAISFASVLKQAGFERASVATIMKNQTIGQLAAALSDDGSGTRNADEDVEQAKLALKAHAQRHLGAAAKALRLRIEDIETVTPCTPLQQGLILESLRDDTRPYFNDFEYELYDVDPERLEQAFHRLIDRVQVLRSSFVGLDEGHSQVVRKQSHSPICRLDSSIRSLESVLRDEKDRWIRSNSDELVTPLEIHIGNVQGASIFIVHIHHALYDAISYELLMGHLWQLYSTDASVRLGPTFTDALPYGPLKRNPGAEIFWKERLQGIEFSPLPARFTDSASDSIVQRSLRNSAKFEHARQSLGVSHQAMAQAAFEVALRKASFSKLTQTYGVVVSGRSIELEGADRVLGPMFNTLPQLVTMDPAMSLAEHIQHCHKLNVEALPHQHTPLRDIRKWLGLQSGGPMFDILFVFQHTPSEAGQEESKLCTPIESRARAEFPLVCEVELRGDGHLELTLLAQGRYLNQANLEQLGSDLQAVFDAVVYSPEVNLGKTFGIEKLIGTTSVSRPTQRTSLVNGVEHFEWTEEASLVRDAVAQLAGLNLEDVDEHSSIFSLGLDSIDAVKVASRLRHTGLSLPVSEIIKAQTIPRMLRKIQMQDNATVPSGASKLRKLEDSLKTHMTGRTSNLADIERILPVTPNQEALVADMIRSDFKEYLNHDILRLHPQTDLSRVRDAWQSVVDASPVLRTSFSQVDDPNLTVVFAQLVHKSAPINMAEIKVESIDQIDDYLSDVREDVSATWNRSPALRLTIAHTGKERYLVLSIAHALYDGHSLALLHEDVQRAYAGKLDMRPSYDESIEASLTAVKKESVQFWTDTLSGASPRAFPRSKEDPTDKTHRFETQSELSSDTVRSFCQRQGVSMQALAQTCWTLTLAHYTQALDVLFGVVLACRDSEEAEQIMFPMMNTVVMRSSLHGSRTDMLRYMQSAIAETLPHQRTPLRSIQKACSSTIQDRATLGGSLFDTLFIYQHRPEAQGDTGEALYESVGGSSNVDYPVAVELEAVGDAVAIRAACKSSVFGGQGTQELVNRIDAVLQSVVARPTEPTVDLTDGEASICGLPAFDVRLSEPSVERQIDGAQDIEYPPEPSEDDSSPMTAEILEAFAQVSDVPASELAPTSTIESIGIDSISAIKVASLLRKKDIKLSVSEIVRAKSAARMAELVSKRPDQPAEKASNSGRVISEVMRSIDISNAASSAGVDPKDVESVLPATAGQVYMLSMWKKTGGQVFCPTFTYRLQFNVREDDIRKAWTGLVKQHPILRTVFAPTNDKGRPFMQLVVREDTAVGASQEQPMASRDVRQANGGYELNLKIHHALYDAVSLPLLMQDLEYLLADKPLNEPKVKQEDVIALSVIQQSRAQQKDFWMKYLQSTTPIKLPQPSRDGPQPKVEIFTPGLFSRTTDLDALARREGLSIQVLLFAAYAKVYTSFPAKTGTVATDVVLGTYLSNRSHLPELDSLAAPTLNLVPLLVRSPKHHNLLDVAKEVQRDLQEIGTPERSATGLWEIAGWTGVRVDTFVNFLKLPERSEVDRNGDDDMGAKLEEVSDRRVRARREVVEPERSGDFAPPPGLKDMGVDDAYQHSVDIEMTVTEGKLDVGLFAPVEMLSLEEADAALAEFKALLEEFVGKGKGKA